MTVHIRPARTKDRNNIVRILKELDIFYTNQSPEGFWLAEKDNKIAGVVQFEEHPDFYFLSSLGVAPDQQNQGIATQLLNKLLKTANKNVYLYTIIPDFFQKFGFQTTHLPAGQAGPPNHLPSMSPYECKDCCPDKCVCMVRPTP